MTTTTTDAPIARRLTIAISVASAAITIAVIVTAGTVLGWFGPARTQTATETVPADAALPVQEVPAADPVIVYEDDEDHDEDD